MADPLQVITFTYSVFILVVYGALVADAYGQWKVYRDRRSWSDMLDEVAYFAVAVAIAIGLLLYWLGIVRSAPNVAVLLLAAGAFAYAGFRKLRHRRKGREP